MINCPWLLSIWAAQLTWVCGPACAGIYRNQRVHVYRLTDIDTCFWEAVKFYKLVLRFSAIISALPLNVYWPHRWHQSKSIRGSVLRAHGGHWMRFEVEMSSLNQLNEKGKKWKIWELMEIEQKTSVDYFPVYSFSQLRLQSHLYQVHISLSRYFVVWVFVLFSL